MIRQDPDYLQSGGPLMSTCFCPSALFYLSTYFIYQLRVDMTSHQLKLYFQLFLIFWLIFRFFLYHSTQLNLPKGCHNQNPKFVWGNVAHFLRILTKRCLPQIFPLSSIPVFLFGPKPGCLPSELFSRLYFDNVLTTKFSWPYVGLGLISRSRLLPTRVGEFSICTGWLFKLYM